MSSRPLQPTRTDMMLPTTIVKKSARNLAAVLAFGTLFLTGTSEAFAGMTTVWKETTASERSCIERAKQAMRDSDFTENLEVVGQTVFGNSGRYEAAARCITSKELIFFVVAGPDSPTTNRRVTTIRDNY